VHRRYPSIATAITAFVAQACGLVASNADPSDDASHAAGTTGQSTGGKSSSGGSGSGGVVIGAPGGLGGFGIDVTTPCAPNVLPLASQVVDQVGEQRVFYSWTTDEQVAELRAGTALFSRSERPGEGRGLLFSELATLAASTSDDPAPALADVLVNQTFAKARFAWPNPWATLLGFPGETYGNQLLRIELRPEAWIARFERGELSVYDAQNQPVPLEQALASPERIGAIFYQSRGESGRQYCGTFSQGSVGFREFALGNISMVQNWSLATPQIRERLEADLAELAAFEDQLACFGDTSSWSTDVTCEWDGSHSPGLLSNYDFALGLPSELYRPSPENIEALMAALEASLPTGEPLMVIPPR
jgi:hypothetical protein